MNGQELKIIARIRSGFSEKFGIPRQSGLVETKAEIVFEPEFRAAEALRGIAEYSYLWLIWGFSESRQEHWKATVRPPRLGGNKRVGVFATRSPFRPNPLGLSSVRLLEVRMSKGEGGILVIEGADLLDGTPIYDIKPYLSYVDSHPEAKGAFAEEAKDYSLVVDIPDCWKNKIPQEQLPIIVKLLSQDPRPAYQCEPMRIYGMKYDGLEIHFQVNEGRLLVCEITEEKSSVIQKEKGK